MFACKHPRKAPIMSKAINFRSSKLKLTYLLMAPLTGLLIAAGAGLHALQEAQIRNAAALQTDRNIHAGLRAAQLADAAFARQAAAWDDQAKAGGEQGLDTLQRNGAALSDQLMELAAVMSRLGVATAAVGEAGRLHTDLAAQYGSALKDGEAAQRLARQYGALGQTMRQAADSLEQFAQQETQRLDSASQAQFDRMVSGLAALIALATAIGIFLRVTIRRNMVSSTRAGADAAERIAAGDLTVQIEVPTNGQSKATLAAMKKMIADLRTLVGGVAASARTVADASAQIAQGNLDLSQRTEQQASTLEETAASMEELSSTVAQTARWSTGCSKTPRSPRRRQRPPNRSRARRRCCCRSSRVSSWASRRARSPRCTRRRRARPSRSRSGAAPRRRLRMPHWLPMRPRPPATRSGKSSSARAPGPAA